jgi:hypothetical protein
MSLSSAGCRPRPPVLRPRSEPTKGQAFAGERDTAQGAPGSVVAEADAAVGPSSRKRVKAGRRLSM